MKVIRNLFLGVVALLLTLLVVNDYFHAGFPYTHDGENHLARFANYKIALKEGQFPPRFAPNLMNHYGYPVFNYNYPLANILSLPFSLVGLNYELTFKILVAFAVWFGLVGVGSWLKRLRFSIGGVVTGMVAFALSPYLLSTIIYRGSIGEVMALGLLPWLLVVIEKIKDSHEDHISWQWLARAVSMIAIFTAFFLSHNVTVLFGVPLVLLYAGWRFMKDDWRRCWTQLGVVLLFGITLSLWFWLPAIAEKSFVIIDAASLSSQFTSHFATLSQLLFSPLGFGYSYLGSIDSLSLQVGLLQVVSLVVATIVLLKLFAKRAIHWRNPLIFLLVAVLASLIFQLPISQSVWRILPFSHFIQFPWRLELFTAVLIAPLCAFAWQVSNKWGKVALLSIIIVQTFSFVRARPADYFHKLNRDYDAFSQSTTTANENTAQTFRYQEIGDWQPGPRLVKGTGEFIVKRWNGTYREYEAHIWEPAIVAEPTMLFPGWETVIHSSQDQAETKIPYYDDDQVKGRLAYQLQPGEYLISSQFTQKTWARVTGNLISGLTALILLLIIFRHVSKSLRFYASWKVVLLMVAALASVFFSYHPHFPYSNILLIRSNVPRWLYSWANFDGVHYITIAEHGYKGTGLVQAFFPVYPGLIAALNLLVHNYVLSGLLLSTVFGFLTVVMWQKVLALDFDTRTSWLGVLVLFLFPTAFFFQALYSESLFIWLVLTTFFCARRQRWWLAGLCAAVASATRIVGIILVPALLVELWLQHKESGEKIQVKQLLAIGIGVSGLLAYMSYLQVVFHDALYFIHVQTAFGTGRQQSLVLYPQVVWRYIKIMMTYRPFNLNYFTYAQEFAVGVLGLIGLVWSWFTVRKSYVVFGLLAFMVPTMTGTFSSIPRYVLASFALFIAITKVLENHQRLRWLYFTISTLLLVFNTILFVQGYWVA